MGWERSFAFIGILIAIVFVLENISLLRSRKSPAQGPKEHVPVEVRDTCGTTSYEYITRMYSTDRYDIIISHHPYIRTRSCDKPLPVVCLSFICLQQ